MSAIDHAAVRIEAPGTRAPAWRRRLVGVPPAWRLAVGFALLQIPLTILAVAFEWRTTWGTPEETGPILTDFLKYGSVVSGPLAPQLALLVLALLARRRGRLGAAGTVGIGLIGLLVTFNGAMEPMSDPVWTPRAVLVASGVMYIALGGLLVTSAVRDLAARRAATGSSRGR